MIRFADLLAKGLRERGLTVEIISPRPKLLGKNFNPNKGLGKWLGYVDKWILFPMTLRRFIQKREHEFANRVSYHICDHSNAPYLAHLPRARTAITCHDVLAIRGAMGYTDAYCSASRTGKILQRWILKHLSNSQRLACVSQLTLDQLCEIAAIKNPRAGWKVVHNAFNADFRELPKNEAMEILRQKGIVLPQPFLLHVGSNLPRKNRALLLQLFKSGNQPWPGHVCFAGEPMDAGLTETAQTIGILDRTHSVPKPDHTTLCALYSLAHAFIFPSFSEGFGWPLIEAQACGTPVIASHLKPLPEVSGGAALFADPHDATSFASALELLNNETVRESFVEKGKKNIARFDVRQMVEKYIQLHEAKLDETVATTT